MLSGPKYRRLLLKIHGTAWIQALQTADLTVGGSEAPSLAVKMRDVGITWSIIYLTVASADDSQKVQRTSDN